MSSDVRTVEITWEGRPGATVSVAGDFPDFRVPHPLIEERPGAFRVRFVLPPGVYRYKLLVDGAWTLDPTNPSVDAAEGVRNNLLVVGGAAPPLFFAPDRRHIENKAHGDVVLHLETVDDAAPPAAFVVGADGESHPVAWVERMRRGDRRFLEGRAAQAGPARFVEMGGTRFTAPAPRGRAHEPPSWLDGAVIYGVFIDRWRRGRGSPPERRMLAPTTPSTPFVFYGGDLDGIAESAGDIASLGVTAVALTPVTRSDSPHHYDAHDLLDVDARLGGEAALDRAIEACHRERLKVIVDLSLTHVHERSAPFQDLLARQERSSYRDWFRVKRFPVVARDNTTVGLYYNSSDQPWLRLDDDSPARDWAIEAALKLVRRGVDGLRLDAMDDAPASFWEELRLRVRALRPDTLLLGEVVTDAVWNVAEERGADVVTDFRTRDALLSFVGKRQLDARGFIDSWELASFRTGAFPAAFRLAFLDNHDTARFLSLCGDERRLRCALAILLFMPETAWVTYGTEAHLAARRGERALDSAWPERLPMPEPGTVATDTLALLKRACAIRRGLLGGVEVVEARGSRLTLLRESAEAAVTLTVDVDAGEPSYDVR